MGTLQRANRNYPASLGMDGPALMRSVMRSRTAKLPVWDVWKSNPAEETRWLSPRRLTELSLITLPSPNRLTQPSARSLIYSSSPSVTLSIPPALTSSFASPSVPPSLFPLENSRLRFFWKSIPCSFFALRFYCLPLLTAFRNSLIPLFSFLSFPPSRSSLHTFHFFFFFVMECVMSLQLIPSLKHLSNAR